MVRFLAPRRLLAAGLVGLVVAGCTPITATRGHMVAPELVSQLRPGVSRQDDVLSLLGSPSTTGTFDDRVWYYIGQHTAQRGIFAPEVTDRRIVAIRFDERGVVTEVEEYGLEHGREVEIVDRTTPTAGRDLTFLQQILGNLGRFNRGAEPQ